jgi:hypothetical protein
LRSCSIALILEVTNCLLDLGEARGIGAANPCFA